MQVCCHLVAKTSNIAVNIEGIHTQTHKDKMSLIFQFHLQNVQSYFDKVLF